MAYDLDAIIRRQLYLQRYANRYALEILDLVKSDDKKIVSIIREFFDEASQRDVTALLKSNENNYLVGMLFNNLKSTIATQQEVIATFAQQEMYDLSESEVIYTYKALDSVAESKPSINEILKLPVLGVSGSDGYKAINNNYINTVIKEIKDSTQNNTDPVLAIKGTKDLRFKDGVINKKNNALVAQAVTQVNGVAGNSRSKSYSKFKIDKVVVSATLDFRTTPICRSRDGNVYLREEAPQPPYHFRCRTVLLPWLGQYEERPFVADHRSVKDIPQKDRKKIIGTTTETYSAFFARQKAKDQKEILGASRYELYKSGKFDIKDFVDERTGYYYTLKELDRL